MSLKVESIRAADNLITKAYEKEKGLNKRLTSRRSIAALAIGTGLVVGFTLFGGAPVRAEHAETTLTITQEQIIDELQENGSIPELRMPLPHELVFDEAQENGEVPEVRTAVPDELLFDEVQENGVL